MWMTPARLTRRRASALKECISRVLKECIEQLQESEQIDVRCLANTLCYLPDAGLFIVEIYFLSRFGSPILAFVM